MNVEMESGLQDRLHKVKTAVWKATEEALHTAANEDPIRKLRSFNAENTDPNQASSESFALGMALFGQETSVIEREIRNRLTGIERDLTNVVEAIKVSGDNDFEEHQSAEELEAESQELITRIKFLTMCSTARSHLDESATLSSVAASNDPDFVEAARKLQLAIQSVGGAQAIVKAEESRSSEPTKALLGAYRIIDSIQTAIRRRKVDLMSRANSLLENSITFSPHSISVKGTRITSSNQHLQGLHAAYDILAKLSPSDTSTLEGTIRRIVDKFVDIVIQPVLDEMNQVGKPSLPWNFDETSTRITHIMEWGRDEDTLAEADDLHGMGNVFEFTLRTIKFFHKHVLLEREDLCKIVGERFFGSSEPTSGSGIDLRTFGLDSKYVGSRYGSIMKAMTKAIWDNCIPTTLRSDELHKLKDVARNLEAIINPFDIEMRSLDLYTFESGSKSPLFDVTSKFEQKFVEKKRCSVLNEARQILLKSDYHNTVEIGDEVSKPEDTLEDDGLSVFRFHKCAVSETAVRILKLCRKTLDETVSIVVEDPEDPIALLPATLYKSAREILDLFRAIIPTTYDREIHEIPRTAGVLHNDALFLAHACLTLGIEYKERFPPVSPNDMRGQALRETCMFVDMVPVFRELADKALGDMIEKQHDQLWELAGSRISLLGQSLRSNESLSEWEDAETAMNAALYHIRHLSKAWTPVLSKEVYGRSVGFLLDTIFNLYLEQIFKADDISENACHFVSAVFRAAMQGALELLRGDTEGCQVWDRFSAVGRFADMSIVDINIALSEGVFRSVTGQELSRLITATFGDSSKRRQLLQALASES